MKTKVNYLWIPTVNVFDGYIIVAADADKAVKLLRRNCTKRRLPPFEVTHKLIGL